MSESNLKRTKNWFRAVGVLSEKKLELSESTVKIYENGKPTGEEVDCELISGTVSIKANGKISSFGVYFSSIAFDGKEAKTWKMAQAMMNKWEPEINGFGETPTVVALEGTIGTNDYVKQNGEVASGIRWNVRTANTRVTADEPHGCSCNLTAFVNSVKPEMYNEEETGRLMVELLGADNNGALIPVNCYVEEDLADAFNDCYSIGDTANFDIDRIEKHIGGTVANKKKAFGAGSAVAVNNGFDKTELIIVGADAPIEEPDELTYTDDNGEEHEIETEWMNPKAVKKALKVRAAMLEELKNNPPKSNKKGNSTASALQSAKQRTGKPKSNVSEADYPEDELESLF